MIDRDAILIARKSTKSSLRKRRYNCNNYFVTKNHFASALPAHQFSLSLSIFKNCSEKHASTIDFHYHHRKRNALLNNSSAVSEQITRCLRIIDAFRTEGRLIGKSGWVDLTRNRSSSFVFLLRARDKNY